MITRMARRKLALTKLCGRVLIERQRGGRLIRCATILAALIAAFSPQVAAAELMVQDDTQQNIVLSQPAQRIVALAPHIAEQLFAVGAGERIVGTVEYADYPVQARTLPRVGRAHSLDLERIAALKPDLIVIWGSGYPPALRDAVKRLGVPLFVNEPADLESVATSLERLSVLTGGGPQPTAALEFRQRIAALRARYLSKPTLRVFYQVWADPLMTLSGRHVLNEAIRLCGGRNIFETLAPIAPQVSVEAVVAADPQVIITTEADSASNKSLERWKSFSGISAVRNKQLVVLDGSRLNRHGPRMAQEIAVMCERLEQARSQTQS